jgi:hypothetical protein
MTVEGDKSTASSRRCMRVYAPSSCIVKVDNGCAGPWKAAFGIKMLPTKTIQTMLSKKRDDILQFFLRLCRATNRFTCPEGVLGVHGVPTKKGNVSQKMVHCQNNGMAIRSQGGRTHFVHPKYNRKCMTPMEILHANATTVSLSK